MPCWFSWSMQRIEFKFKLLFYSSLILEPGRQSQIDGKTEARTHIPTDGQAICVSASYCSIMGSHVVKCSLTLFQAGKSALILIQLLPMLLLVLWPKKTFTKEQGPEKGLLFLLFVRMDAGLTSWEVGKGHAQICPSFSLYLFLSYCSLNTRSFSLPLSLFYKSQKAVSYTHLTLPTIYSV